MDGNRRYAKSRGLKPWKGHEAGARKIEDVLGWCKNLGIKELTLYTFSVQNFKRSEEEKRHLMDLMRINFKKIMGDSRMKDIKIQIIGRISMFPEDIQDIITKLMNATKDNTVLTLNFAMGYGGREEIVDAARKVAELVKKDIILPEDVTEATLTENMYLQTEPDLIIRTGGDHRTSNFLMWQSSYSEWHFSEKMWPELDFEDFKLIMKDFLKRKRRFGK